MTKSVKFPEGYLQDPVKIKLIKAAFYLIIAVYD